MHPKTTYFYAIERKNCILLIFLSRKCVIKNSAFVLKYLAVRKDCRHIYIGFMDESALKPSRNVYNIVLQKQFNTETFALDGK